MINEKIKVCNEMAQFCQHVIHECEMTLIAVDEGLRLAKVLATKKSNEDLRKMTDEVIITAPHISARTKVIEALAKEYAEVLAKWPMSFEAVGWVKPETAENTMHVVTERFEEFKKDFQRLPELDEMRAQALKFIKENIKNAWTIIRS